MYGCELLDWRFLLLGSVFSQQIGGGLACSTVCLFVLFLELDALSNDDELIGGHAVEEEVEVRSHSIFVLLKETVREATVWSLAPPLV